MSTMKLDIVTAEQVVFSDDVDMVIAHGAMGQLGILPHHTPLMTTLRPGELRIKRAGDKELTLVVSGGFLEVRPDRVIVLADAAERGEEIDVARAEEAKKRAEERLAKHVGLETERAEAALHRAMARLMVAEKVKRRKRS